MAYKANIGSQLIHKDLGIIVKLFPITANFELSQFSIDFVPSN